MGKNDEKSDRFLHSSGRLGRLRWLLIAFFLNIEGIRENLAGLDKVESDYLDELVERIDALINDFASIQMTADRIIIKFSTIEIKNLYKELPELFEIFGWQDRIDKN